MSYFFKWCICIRRSIYVFPLSSCYVLVIFIFWGTGCRLKNRMWCAIRLVKVEESSTLVVISLIIQFQFSPFQFSFICTALLTAELHRSMFQFNFKGINQLLQKSTCRFYYSKRNPSSSGWHWISKLELITFPQLYIIKSSGFRMFAVIVFIITAAVIGSVASRWGETWEGIIFGGELYSPTTAAESDSQV